MNQIITKDNLSLIISTKLTQRLNELGMSQRELADLSGISEVSISRYVNMTRMPNAYSMINMANALNCTIDYLIGR